MSAGKVEPTTLAQMLPVQQILAGGVGTLPLAPISAVTEAQLPGIIEQMKQRLSRRPVRGRAASLWAAHQGTDEPKPPQNWAPEDALITRPEADVVVRVLPAGGYEGSGSIGGPHRELVTGLVLGPYVQGDAVAFQRCHAAPGDGPLGVHRKRDADFVHCAPAHLLAQPLAARHSGREFHPGCRPPLGEL